MEPDLKVFQVRRSSAVDAEPIGTLVVESDHFNSYVHVKKCHEGLSLVIQLALDEVELTRGSMTQ